MKKSMAVLCVIALLIGLLAGCAGKQEETTASVSYSEYVKN